MNWLLESVVTFLTFLVFLLGPAWWMERRQNRRVPVARLADPAPLPGESLVRTATSTTVFHSDDLRMQPGELPRAGRLELPAPNAGAQDRSYEARGYFTGIGAQTTWHPAAPVPWDLAGAAYALGQQRASADEITREVAAIIAEIEADPRRWQR